MERIRPYRINYREENVLTKISPTALEIKNPQEKEGLLKYELQIAKQKPGIIFECLATGRTSLQLDNNNGYRELGYFKSMLASDIPSERKGLIIVAFQVRISFKLHHVKKKKTGEK